MRREIAYAKLQAIGAGAELARDHAMLATMKRSSPA
jgi:hypothetical protein